jgi:3-hydroxyacyl-CoA dehydrogenase
MYIFKAAVVGAGAMGAEIAQVISYSGLPVVLKDVDQEMLDKGMARIRGIYQSRVNKGKMDAHTMEDKLALIEPTLDYHSFADVDIVIEAVPERMDIKKAVLAELQGACPEGTIFASNTSALSISEMGAATDRPGRVVGMHFFNPAHVMKLVEVIPGLDTDEDTVDTVVGFAESLRKIPVVVRECPGFLVNRLLVPCVSEAGICLQEGAATAEEIDEAMVAFGMPMGPFTLMDMTGIDIAHDVGQTLIAEYGDRMATPLLFERLYEKGRFGQKAGVGFYDYGAGESEPLADIIAEVQKELGITEPTEFSVERLIYPMINEAALCLQENIASAADIDMAMVAGIGMTYHGERIGPLAVADEVGLDVVVDTLNDLQAKYGDRFRPCRHLRLKVKANHLGKKTGKGFHEYSG